MARRSLRPQLNQIRDWVRQGRTDAWIAHQLDISASELREFREQHGLDPDSEGPDAAADLRDEIEAEIEAAQEAEPEPEEDDEADDEEADGSEAEGRPREAGGEEKPKRRRRRGRRGRGRGRKGAAIEATFDHGEKDGYGLWFDPAVKDNQTYSQHWAGKRAVTVTIEPERIVITRVAEDSNPGDTNSGNSGQN